MSTPPVAAASRRNATAILGVLRYELSGCSSVLEIGSGTGQHAVAFAAELPTLTWQTSDLAMHHPGIQSHIDASDLCNVKSPLDLDVREASIASPLYDAVFTCNTMHIMSFAAVEKMLVFASTALFVGGVFCVYGPFKLGGAFNTESNAHFDASLRASDRDKGIRDLEAVDEIAARSNLQRARGYAMPANNLLLVWIRSAGRDS